MFLGVAVKKHKRWCNINIPIRIIPGISAGIGGLAYAGIPVTHRDVNQSVTFVTGHDQSGQTPSSLDWEAISNGFSGDRDLYGNEAYRPNRI